MGPECSFTSSPPIPQASWGTAVVGHHCKHPSTQDGMLAEPFAGLRSFSRLEHQQSSPPGKQGASLPGTTGPPHPGLGPGEYSPVPPRTPSPSAMRP